MTKLVTYDYTIERPPRSPLELAAEAARRTQSDTSTSAATSTGDESDDDANDEQRERELRAEWREFWSRVTRSSGAPIPNFPGTDKAERFLATRSRS